MSEQRSLNPSVGTVEPRGPALGMLEIASVAQGYEAADRVVKASSVELVVCLPVTPGKFLVLFSGEVAEVTSSLSEGARGLADNLLVDQLFLPHPDPRLAVAISGTRVPQERDTLGVVEAKTVATLLVAADVGVKMADVELVAVRFAMRLGGKAFCLFAGEVSQVRAAVTGAAGHAAQSEQLVSHAVIPSAHSSLWAFV